MLFSVRFLLKASSGEALASREPVELYAAQASDASLLATLPVRGDTVVLPPQGSASAPVSLGSFLVEGRAFNYLPDMTHVDVVLTPSGTFPLSGDWADIWGAVSS
jgi:hypothetical protein